MYLVIPLKVNEHVTMNFNKCWLIGVWLSFGRAKVPNSIRQFFSCFELVTAGGSVALQMLLTKHLNADQILSSVRAVAIKLEPRERQEEPKKNSEESLRLLWTENAGVVWIFHHLMQPSYIAFLTGLDLLVHEWHGQMISKQWLCVCVCVRAGGRQRGDM